MILYDSRAANAPSPRIRRAKTPFARLCSLTVRPQSTPAATAAAGPAASCPQPPVCRDAPKISCPISRELSNSRISRNSAHTCATPSTAAEGPPARPIRDHARGLRQTRLPSCAQNFFAQSLVNSRPSLVRGLCPPIRRRRASSAARAPPPRQPCCAQNFLPNLTHSLVISRYLSCISPACQPLQPRNTPKMFPISNVNPV